MTKPITVFKVGQVNKACTIDTAKVQRRGREIVIEYPARLEAMALDPAKIATNESMIYTAGQIDVCVDIYKTVTVSVQENDGDVLVSERTQRKSLVIHAARLMKAALGIQSGLVIDIVDTLPLRHCGLGSSSGTIAAVASAINELYGKPIKAHDLVLYCAQNHGEEIDGDDDSLVAVQCIGGSAICGNYRDGLVVLAGEATKIGGASIPDEFSVVIGIPNDYTHPDSRELMQAEEDNMDGFLSTGDEYGKTISYELVHSVLPALAQGDVYAAKRLVFEYRWNMGSIKNCSFVLPRINDIAESLRSTISDENIALLALSSVGPGFFGVTKDPNTLEATFSKLNMTTHRAKAHNGIYIVKRIS